MRINTGFFSNKSSKKLYMNVVNIHDKSHKNIFLINKHVRFNFVTYLPCKMSDNEEQIHLKRLTCV